MIAISSKLVFIGQMSYIKALQLVGILVLVGCQQGAYGMVQVIEEVEDLPLHAAAAVGDRDAIVKLLEADNDFLELRNDKGETALHCAFKHRQLNSIHCLINLRADLEARDLQGWTPYWKAVQDKELSTFSCILRAKFPALKVPETIFINPSIIDSVKEIMKYQEPRRAYAKDLKKQLK